MNTLEQHVHDIAKREGIEVVYRGSGLAYRRKRRITIAPILGQVSYLIALHELGHVLGPNPGLRLAQEAAAWKWALDHSIVEPTPASYRSIVRRLDSYGRRAERWANMKRPPEFDEFLNRMRVAAQ